MIVTISLSGDTAVLAHLSSMSEAVQAALYQKVTELTLRLEALIKSKLSGTVLNVGPNTPGHTGGQLRASIHSKVERQAQAVLGTVASSSDVPYGAIHEYGGQTSAHLIYPKRAAVLAFTSGGKQRFARFVNHPGSSMPERSFMRSSLRDMSTEISLGIKQAAIQAIQQVSS